MDADPDTYIVNNIRDPWKLLILDADIGVAVGPLAFLGFALQKPIPGLIVAGLIAYYWQTWRSAHPKGAGARVIWWHTPSEVWFTQKLATLPSHKREFIG